MKKVRVCLFYIIVLLSFICGTRDVQAVSYSVDKVQACKSCFKTTQGNVNINIYQATVIGEDGTRTPAETYCVDPGKSYKGDGGGYTLQRVIDPTTNAALDLAVAGTLQKLDEFRSSGVDETSMSYIGDVAMRWVYMQYGGSAMKSGYVKNGELHTAYKAFSNSDYAISVNGNTAIVQYAREAFQAGIAAASAGSYDNAVAQGLLYDPQFEAVEYTETLIEGSRRRVSFIIQPKNTSLTPDKFTEYVDGFTATCNNKTVTCTVDKKTARYEPAGVIIEMIIDTKNWDNQDFNITVDPAYCDSKDAATQILQLGRGASNLYQRMLVIMRGYCPAKHTSLPTRPRRPSIRVTRGDSCECNYNSSGEWDGTYTVTQLKDGSVTNKFTINKSETSKVQQYSCPSADKCKKPISCQKSSSSKTGYYCKDGSECNKERYEDECTNTCKTPSESGTNDYWCSDGEKCPEQEYRVDCLGEVNCTPTITTPSDCNNFDTNSTYTGLISDINQISSSCNSAVNQIKKCVLGKKDLTNTTFEATNEIEGNPYCKVWCTETYNFKLPTAQYSQSGGYFTLSTTINGKRDCFTSSADDPTKEIGIRTDGTSRFEEDLTRAQHEVIDAWNEYNHWRVAADTAYVIKEGSDKAEGGCCESCCGGGTPDDPCEEKTCEGGYTVNWKTVEKSWHYDIFDYNGEKKINGGYDTYSDGDVEECGCCECPSDNIGEEASPSHESLRDAAKQVLIEKINALNTVISNYNSCTGVITNAKNSDLATIDASSTSTSSWDNDMIFEPEVDFVYNEDYMSQMNGKFTQVDGSESSKYVYCSGSTDDQYNCQSGKTSTIQTYSKPVLTCDDNGCTPKNFNVSTAKWVQKTKENVATYKPENKFSTYTPYGTVKIKYDKCNGNDCLWTRLPETALPVSLITKTGVFPFKFTFSNIGQSNQDSSLGRLMGEPTSIITEYNKLSDGLKCQVDKNVTATVDGGYVCHYLNNCDDCDFTCDDDNNCKFDEPDCIGDKCILTCENCIFDGEKNTFSYRTVSLNKLFPNERTDSSSFNWNTTDKGKLTKAEIEEKGESIYETPEYSYTLTPTNLKNIRDYNDRAGSYSNNKTPDLVNGNDSAIYCENITLNGKEYNVKCKSRFLDLIENSGNKYAQSTGNNKYIRNANGFTLYTDESVENQTGCGPSSGYKCLKEKGIGPAWK